MDRHARGQSVTSGALGHALAPPLLVAAAFLAAAWLSWRRLGSLIIDGGHELDVPRRLLEGAALYRDVSWSWGPLAPWIDTGLYRLFGVHSDTLMWAGLLTAALACAGLYLLARFFVGPFTSAWVAIAFIATSAFARRMDVAIFNFVAPFNFSATYGITLAIGSVVLLLHHARSGRAAPLAGSAVLAGLVALTKMETAFAILVAHATFFLTVLPRPSRARIVAWGCGLAVVVAGYAAAAWTSDGVVWRSMVGLFNRGSQFYIRDSMGLRNLGASLIDLVLSLIGWAVVLGSAAWLASRGEGSRPRWALPVVWIALLVLPAFVLERIFFRAAPLLLAAGLVWIGNARIRQGADAFEGRWREHLVVWAFALGALPRILLRVGVDHYGFYLLSPTFVCVAIGMTVYLGRRTGRPPSPHVRGLAAATVLAGVALGTLVVSYPQLTRAVSELRTARVHRLVDAGGAEASFVPFLSRLPPGTVCAAVPEGEGIIFASGLTPPADGMTSYLPMIVEEPGAQQRILEAWKRAPPEVIFSWEEDQSRVFGYAGFGRDYGLDLARWISEQYEATKEPSAGHATLLVRRRSR